MTATKPIEINFPIADRLSVWDPKLYSFAQVPGMDKKGEDYVLTLTVRAADPRQERQMADTCTTYLNGAPKAVSALVYALNVLDSVAFLQVEGDTDDVKEQLRNALAELRIPEVTKEQKDGWAILRSSRS
jgi:hypothetical protein